MLVEAFGTFRIGAGHGRKGSWLSGMKQKSHLDLSGERGADTYDEQGTPEQRARGYAAAAAALAVAAFG